MGSTPAVKIDHDDVWRGERELLKLLANPRWCPEHCVDDNYENRRKRYVWGVLNLRKYDFFGEPVSPEFLTRFRKLVAEICPEALL